MGREKRGAKRIKEEGSVSITLVSKDALTPGKKISYHLTKDISSTGMKILATTFLPVKSLLKIDLTLIKPPKLFSAFGEVRWVKTRFANELFEIGIEFVDTPAEVIRVLQEHIEKSEQVFPSE
jgi:c-di-GMP-binding flagellar brake protein YcgR